MDEAMLERVLARVYPDAQPEKSAEKKSLLPELLRLEEEREQIYIELSERSPVLREALREIRRTLSDRLRTLRTAIFLQTGENGHSGERAAVRSGTLTLLRQAYHSAERGAQLYERAAGQLRETETLSAALQRESRSIEKLLRRVMH